MPATRLLSRTRVDIRRRVGGQEGWRSALGILVALIAMAALISSLALTAAPPPPTDTTDRDNAGGEATDSDEGQSEPTPSGWRLVELA